MDTQRNCFIENAILNIPKILKFDHKELTHVHDELLMVLKIYLSSCRLKYLD